MKRLILCAAAALALPASSDRRVPEGRDVPEAGIRAQAQEGRAAILILKDENIIECKVLRRDKKNFPDGRRNIPCWVVRDEIGTEHWFPTGDVRRLVWLPRTSWEIRAENKKWYETEAAKIKEDDLKGHLRLAKDCSKRRYLDEEAIRHFRRAYELEKPEVKDVARDVKDFAEKLVEEYELYDEGMAEFRRYVALQHQELEASGRLTPGSLLPLAKDCRDLELYDEARRVYEEILRIQPQNNTAKAELKALLQLMRVPVDRRMYKHIRPAFARGIHLIKSKQNQDGSFGDDFFEAGVHARRGITAVCTIALWADWQFAKFEDYDKAAPEIPVELDRALQLLMDIDAGVGDPSEKRLEGDDMWGPIFALEALALCAREEAVMQKYGDTMLKAIKDHVERLGKLQRKDGGWYYYNFVGDSASFSTATAIISLETARNLGLEKETIDEMVPKACECVKKQKIGRGTYKYFSSKQYSSSMSPVGASARSPLCTFALQCAGQGDMDDFKASVENWFDKVEILKHIKGSEGTHIGKGMTAPYYFLYSHLYVARAVKLYPIRGLIKRLLRAIAGMMLGYQERDGAWTDWKLPTEDIMKFRVSQTALGLITLWHLVCADRDPAVEPPRAGTPVLAPTPTETEGGKREESKDAPPKDEDKKEREKE